MNKIKELFNKHFRNVWFLVVSIIVLITLAVYNGDSDKKYKKYNGLIVTDKAGNSYMIRGAQFNFTITDFDMNKMRLVE
jgi:hypothetical protein